MGDDYELSKIFDPIYKIDYPNLIIFSDSVDTVSYVLMSYLLDHL